MAKKNIITCSNCNKLYTGKFSREFTTGIKRFTCPNCESENIIPLGKGALLFNNIIMIVFGILSIIVLFDTNWGRGGFSGFLGSLVGNSIVFIPFIFSFLSFLGQRRVLSGKPLSKGRIMIKFLYILVIFIIILILGTLFGR